ncbi:MAG: CBS domain-containing protein, partial [Candidatus Woesearchaeota archaeon]
MKSSSKSQLKEKSRQLPYPHSDAKIYIAFKQELANQMKLTIFFILLLCCSFAQAQSCLPTLLYGKVFTADYKPASNIEVTATWTSCAGIKHTTRAYTLSAGANQRWAGYYFFNQGYIQAQDNSDISIKIGETTLTAKATAGKEPQLLGSVVINQQSPSFQTQAANPSPDPFALSSIPTGMTQPSLISSTVYGQFTDAQGTPLANEEVQMKWTDSKDQTHSVATLTLTKTKAGELGNTSLEGYYFFRNQNVEAKPATQVIIRSDKFNVEQPINLQNETKKDLSLNSTELSKFNTRTPTKNPFTKISAWFLAYYLQLLYTILIILLILLVINSQKLAKKLKQLRDENAIDQLMRQISSFSKTNVRTVMATKYTTISEELALHEIISLFVSKNQSFVIVTKGQIPVGIISELDIIKSRLKTDTNPKAKEIMAPVKTLDPSTNLEQAVSFSLENNIEYIPITSNHQLMGVLTVFTLIESFNKFFSKNIFESQNLIKAGALTDGNVVLAEPHDSLMEALQLMIKENADCIFIMSQQKVLGIITERDIIEELYRNPLNLSNLQAGQVGSENVFSVLPSVSLFEISQLLAQKALRIIPVIVESKLEGVITQARVLSAINDFFNELSRKGHHLKEMVQPTA